MSTIGLIPKFFKGRPVRQAIILAVLLVVLGVLPGGFAVAQQQGCRFLLDNCSPEIPSEPTPPTSPSNGARTKNEAARRHACVDDALRFCSDFIPNVDLITSCMKKNRWRLSEKCRSAIRR